MVRGIHATLIASLTDHSTNLRAGFFRRTATLTNLFITLTEGDYEPETRHVKGTNRCEIDVTRPPGDKVVVTVAIDNLVKGGCGAGHSGHELNAESRRVYGTQYAVQSPLI